MFSLIFREALYAVSGLFVGAIVGPIAVGCGTLRPQLLLLFGLRPKTSIATDLHFVAFAETAGSAVNGCNKSLDWLVVQLLAVERRAWRRTSKASTIESHRRSRGRQRSHLELLEVLFWLHPSERPYFRLPALELVFFQQPRPCPRRC